MFGIGMTELAIILAVALIFIGPKKLPELAAQIAKGMRELRRASDDLKASIMVDLDEPPKSKRTPYRELPPRMDDPPAIRNSQVATGNDAPLTVSRDDAIDEPPVAEPTSDSPGSDKPPVDTRAMTPEQEEAHDKARLNDILNDPAVKDAMAQVDTASGTSADPAPAPEPGEAKA